MSGWRGVGAELHALRDEMHDERWRAYAEHLRVVSELWPRRAAEFEAVWEDQDQVIADALTRLNDERWRAYNRELVLWSELAWMGRRLHRLTAEVEEREMRASKKTALYALPVSEEEGEPLTALDHSVAQHLDASNEAVETSMPFLIASLPLPVTEEADHHALAALSDDEVAKLHGLGPKGAIR